MSKEMPVASLEQHRTLGGFYTNHPLLELLSRIEVYQVGRASKPVVEMGEPELQAIQGYAKFREAKIEGVRNLGQEDELVKVFGTWMSAYIGGQENGHPYQCAELSEGPDRDWTGRILAIMQNSQSIKPLVERLLVEAGFTLKPSEGHATLTVMDENFTSANAELFFKAVEAEIESRNILPEGAKAVDFCSIRAVNAFTLLRFAATRRQLSPDERAYVEANLQLAPVPEGEPQKDPAALPAKVIKTP